MKTTELYIEQVIIGLLVLAIVALPWTPELKGTLGEINLAEGSVLLGLAFLLGIPFDRLADTLTERLDRRHRLQFALARWVGQKFPPRKPRPDNNLYRDIFPEDDFRLEGLRDKDAVVNWIEYHRSRIRLLRALAVYAPALTLSLTLSISRGDRTTSPNTIGIWLGAVAAVYLVWAIITNPPKRLRKKINKASPPNEGRNPIKKVRYVHALFGEDLPRTDHRRFRNYARKWHGIDKSGKLQRSSRSGFRVWSEEWRSLVVPVAVLVAALYVGINYNAKTAWIAVCGALVTVISAWSWWRISSTYRAYLFNLTRH